MADLPDERLGEASGRILIDISSIGLADLIAAHAGRNLARILQTLTKESDTGAISAFESSL
jgi:hypothetical protein